MISDFNEARAWLAVDVRERGNGEESPGEDEAGEESP